MKNLVKNIIGKSTDYVKNTVQKIGFNKNNQEDNHR